MIVQPKLPPGHWKLKLNICQLFHANNYVQVRCWNKVIKGGRKLSEFIVIIIYHVRKTANVAVMCAIVTIIKAAKYRFSVCYYDRAGRSMRTLLDRKNFSSSSNGQVAAHRGIGLIVKRLWFQPQPVFWSKPMYCP